MSDVRECQALDAQFVVRQRRVVVLADRLDRVTQLMHRGTVLCQYQADGKCDPEPATGASRRSLRCGVVVTAFILINVRYHALTRYVEMVRLQCKRHLLISRCMIL